MEISTILNQIDLGSIALPEFQRGYVWNRNQVRSLMDSLYRRHPVGNLLVWMTKTEYADYRGDASVQPGFVSLLLDGQQRITSLYGIIRGEPPAFFEGNPNTFTDLYFNLETEEFEFYGPVKMRETPTWISVTEIMKRGAGNMIGGIYRNPVLEPNADTYAKRLNDLDSIKDIDLHIESITGEDKTVDVVVDIFNRVNSGGTRLSKGDLALAKICAEWPDARKQMNSKIGTWSQRGFQFKLDWLLRCVNATLTGEALFSALDDISASEFQDGLKRADNHVGAILDLLSSRLGIDHDRVLGSRYSFPLLTRYFDQSGGQVANASERDGLLYWYIHTSLWGRYSGQTETALNQDLEAINDVENGLENLIGRLRLLRGSLRITPEDFWGSGRGARFYPLLYILTRVHQAKDWRSGSNLSQSLLGRLSGLELHHIFPKSILYERDYERGEVNSLANMAFLTKETNLYIRNRCPKDYLEEIEQSNPGVLASHWVPTDRSLWKIDAYRDFLSARRELLAQAANEFLDGLAPDFVDVAEKGETLAVHTEQPALGGVADEDEERLLVETNQWVSEHGLPEGELLYELTEGSGDVLAVLDLAWPDGLQTGYSDPTALLIDEADRLVKIVNRAGFRFFTDVEEFKDYIATEVIPTGQSNEKVTVVANDPRQ